MAVVAILVYASGRTQHIEGFPDPPPLTWSWRPDPAADAAVIRFHLARVDQASGIAWYEEAMMYEGSSWAGTAMNGS